MAKNESITISIIDLGKIVELIKHEKPADTYVEIMVVSGAQVDTIRVKDSSGFLIGSFKKNEE